MLCIVLAISGYDVPYIGSIAETHFQTVLLLAF